MQVLLLTFNFQLVFTFILISDDHHDVCVEADIVQVRASDAGCCQQIIVDVHDQLQ